MQTKRRIKESIRVVAVHVAYKRTSLTELRVSVKLHHLPIRSGLVVFRDISCTRACIRESSLCIHRVRLSGDLEAQRQRGLGQSLGRAWVGFAWSIEALLHAAAYQIDHAFKLGLCKGEQHNKCALRSLAEVIIIASMPNTCDLSLPNTISNY